MVLINIVNIDTKGFKSGNKSRPYRCVIETSHNSNFSNWWKKYLSYYISADTNNRVLMAFDFLFFFFLFPRPTGYASKKKERKLASCASVERTLILKKSAYRRIKKGKIKWKMKSFKIRDFCIICVLGAPPFHRVLRSRDTFL